MRSAVPMAKGPKSKPATKKKAHPLRHSEHSSQPHTYQSWLNQSQQSLRRQSQLPEWPFNQVS
jgi:hypothetical protein